MQQRPKVLVSEKVFDGRAFRVVRDEIEVRGRRMMREVVVHPGSVGIIPFAGPDAVLLVEQYRHAVDEWLIEIPAGTLEPGEDPRACAAREIEEETGFRAGRLDELCVLLPSPGILSERMTVFVARDLEPGTKKLDDDEMIRVFDLSLYEAIEWVRRGRIVDAKTVAALLRVYAERIAGKLD